MKLFLTLVLLVLAALLLWVYRSRVRFAFKVATIGYLAILAMNIYRFAQDETRLLELAALMAGAAAVWGVAWLAVTLIARRRADSQER